MPVSKKNATAETPIVRCAIYTRKSTEKGLEQEFNSLDAQREACEAYIASQKLEGWVALPARYDDGGFSGGSLDRPGLDRLMRDIEDGKIDTIVCYKIDRLSRSLMDFTKLVERFERHNVSFVSITQQFSSATPMGKLTLNILLSFAEFERAIIAERVRDKIAGAKRKGKFTGGTPILGYDVDCTAHRLLVNPKEARLVRHIFKRFLEVRSPLTVANELNERGETTKAWVTQGGKKRVGRPWNAAHIHRLLNCRAYLGETIHGDLIYPGEHDAIVTRDLWDKVHRAIQTNNTRTGPGAKSQRPALLRGVIRCGHCGHAMTSTYTIRKNKMYRYYTCVKAIKSGYRSCPVGAIPAGEIEPAVIDQLRAVFRAPETIAGTYRAAKEQEEQTLQELREEQAAFGQELEGSDDTDPVGEKLQQIGRQIEALEGSRLTERDVMEALREIDPIWDTLFPIEQARIVELLVEQITVREDGLDIRIQAQGLHSLVAELSDVAETAMERCA